jgi:adhesin transport system outer membrane protein
MSSAGEGLLRTLGVLTSVCALFAAFPANATTLEEAVRLTLSTNPDIGVVANDRRAVDQELRQSRGLYLPQIDVRGDIGPQDIRNVGQPNGSGTQWRKEIAGTLQQRVFDGFEADSMVARDKARVESAANRVYENSEFRGLDAISAYLGVLRDQDLLRLGQENVKVHDDILGSLQERERGGRGSHSDVSQTQSRLARARDTVASSQATLRTTEATYARVVGQFPHDLQQPKFPENALPPDLQSALALAAVANPTMKIAEADVRTSKAEVSMAQVPYYPKLNIQAEAGYYDNISGIADKQYGYQAQLRMDWNLYRGGIDYAARQEALARMEEAKSKREGSYLDGQQQMRTSWADLQSNHQRVDELRRAVQYAAETRDAYREQFAVAQRTLLDVLDAENELFVARGQLVTAEANELLASYRILAVAGALLTTLGIPAPQEAYVQHKTWWQAVSGTGK